MSGIIQPWEVKVLRLTEGAPSFWPALTRAMLDQRTGELPMFGHKGVIDASGRLIVDYWDRFMLRHRGESPTDVHGLRILYGKVAQAAVLDEDEIRRFYAAVYRFTRHDHRRDPRYIFDGFSRVDALLYLNPNWFPVG